MAVLVGVVLGALAVVRLLGGLARRAGARRAERWRRARAAEVAAESVARSEAVLRGRVTEQLAPLLGGFAFAAADARFLGSPIDFVVFDGLSDVVDGRAARLRRIVLVDVKTGRATLNTVQRRVRACVEDGGVTWYRMEVGV